MNRKKETKKLSNFIKLMLYYIFFMTVHTTSGERERQACLPGESGEINNCEVRFPAEYLTLTTVLENTAPGFILNSIELVNLKVARG
jgi:hypothetical protein